VPNVLTYFFVSRKYCFKLGTKNVFNHMPCKALEIVVVATFKVSVATCGEW
jgi:hypothetical protein